MTDQKYTPSQEEQEANAAKLNAEAAKALAEARKEAAQARTAEITAAKAEIDLIKVQEEEERRNASDAKNHVYRFTGAVTGESSARCISTLNEWRRLDPGCAIEIIFFSPGGSIFDGMVLFDAIKELCEDGPVTTVGSGMAASMAGILLQAGTTREMTRECWLLIHRAAFGAMGSTYEVEDTVKLIKRIEKRIIDIFVSRSGGKISASKIKRNWERKDWWLTSDEALELGLIDRVRGPESVEVPEGE